MYISYHVVQQKVAKMKDAIKKREKQTKLSIQEAQGRGLNKTEKAIFYDCNFKARKNSKGNKVKHPKGSRKKPKQDRKSHSLTFKRAILKRPS